MRSFSTSAEQQQWWMWLWKLCEYILVQSQFCHLDSKSLKNIWISPTYSWCKNQNTFLSLMQRNTGYYHSTRGPKCNPLLRTVCRYIVNIKNKFLCKYVFFSTRFEINICKANKDFKSSFNFFFLFLKLRKPTLITLWVKENPFFWLGFRYNQINLTQLRKKCLLD